MHAARRPNVYRGASFPIDSLWIYGENDSFYTIAHSRVSFDAFVAEGGQGTFNVYRRASGLNGHFIIDDAPLWSADLDRYLREHQ